MSKLPNYLLEYVITVHKMVKYFYSIFLFPYILSYSLIDNTIITSIAPTSNLIFPDGLLVKSGSSAQ